MGGHPIRHNLWKFVFDLTDYRSGVVGVRRIESVM